jgi:excisionase family DNA binding protein
MTNPRLPVKPSVVSPGRRGVGLGEPAPHPVPPDAIARLDLVRTLHQLIETLSELSSSDALVQAAPSRELPLLLDAADAGKLLSLSRSKVSQMAARGEVPSIRVGRAVRIPRDPLLAWVDEHMSVASSTPQVRLPNWAQLDRSNEL